MKTNVLTGLLLSMAACSGSGPQRAIPRTGAAPAPKRLILTTFQPLYSFAAAVVAGSPCLDVANLAPRGQGPHDFHIEEPAHAARCRDLVRRADAVVTLRSLPLAPEAERVYAWCRRENVRIVEIDPAVRWEPGAPRLPLIPDPEDTARMWERASARDHPADRGQKPPSTPGSASLPNPHVWLSLTHAVRLIERIAEDAAALDPDHADLYRSNARTFQKSLRNLKAEYDRKFAGVESLAVDALTDGFPYLTADFGIDVVDYILKPKGPEEVAARVRAAGVKLVLAEEPPVAEVAQAVASTNARVVVLSTIEEGWGEGDAMDPDGYLKAMRSNLETLYEALRR